jgi:hypothetical protein
MPADPRLVRFLNESVRPLSEKARALLVEGEAALAQFQEVASLLPPEGTIDDGRANEGVNQLTGADVAAMVGLLSALVVEVKQSEALVSVMRACVRPLRAE